MTGQQKKSCFIVLKTVGPQRGGPAVFSDRRVRHRAQMIAGEGLGAMWEAENNDHFR